MKETDSLQSLKGIGEKTAQSFQKLSICTISELIHYYPRVYDQFEEISTINSLKEGMQAIIQARIYSQVTEKKVRSLHISNVFAVDSSSQIQLTFFNMPYIRHQLKVGSIWLFRGRVHFRGKNVVMEQPVILKYEDYEQNKKRMLPIYSLTDGLRQNIIRKATSQILSHIQFSEILPTSMLAKYHLCSYDDAIRNIHYPSNKSALLEGHRRLVFDEFLFFLLRIQKLKASIQQNKNRFLMTEVSETNRLIEALPYRLTPDQLDVWNEIKADMTGSYTMNRLVQGDVGSGKTIIAILALLMTISNGYQGAFMAPTEVLALQHFESIRALSKEYHLPFMPLLLTGSLSAKEKRTAYELIEHGKVNCIIGTHALIQEKVKYQKLALVITDEQHRFGVRQREDFMAKGSSPHVCVMSATPIPRTLAMILYGELQVSSIHQLPATRLPIKNCVIPVSDRIKAYSFIQKEIQAGRQVFVICPMIERSEEESDLEDVETYAQKLQTVFPTEVQISILHGKMKPQEKTRIMNAFSKKEIDILVSTTVIEVGINIPNATVMLLENAERFGLAQLHQLRGRVGRGIYQSYCIFVNNSDSEQAQKRLDVLIKSNDGFYIAEQDLSLRGPGDLFGIRQSGNLNFKLADIYQDSQELIIAAEACNIITSQKNWEKAPEYKDLSSYFQHSFQYDIDFPSI